MGKSCSDNISYDKCPDRTPASAFRQLSRQEPNVKLTTSDAHGKVAASLLLMLFFSGCSIKDEASNVSTDVAALQKIVNLDFTPTSARWEIFGTPEYKGGVPGSTDFVTLIAELAPLDEKAFSDRWPAGKVWIAPESARPWLANPFHAMLDKNRNMTIDLATRSDCRLFNATLKQTGKSVKGFACSNAGTLLVYLTIADNLQTRLGELKFVGADGRGLETEFDRLRTEDRRTRRQAEKLT